MRTEPTLALLNRETNAVTDNNGTAGEAAADAEIALFEGLPVAILSDAATRLDLPNGVLGDPSRPVVGGRFAGRAATLDRVARPANVTQDEAAPELKAGLREVVDEAKPGTVLVIATRGDAEIAIWGGNFANDAKAVGIVALVTDGAVRDVDDMAAIGFPVHAQRFTPRGGGYRHYLTLGKNRPVVCCGVYVRPGDIIVGDTDGVIVIAPKDAAAIAAEARKIEQAEEQKAQARTGPGTR